jgi:NADPH-dependent curcumin reductase CurA
MISQYNLSEGEKVGGLMQIVAKSIKFQGFIVSDFPEVEPKFLKDVTEMILNKKIHYQESHAEGIEKTPEALLDVLKGKNFGKQVVDVAKP